jgi:predicted Zn-dependent protease
VILAALILALSLNQAAGPKRPTPAKPSAPAAAASRKAMMDRATASRLAGRLPEAVTLYRQALRQQPDWAEGWFFLGSILYETEKPLECSEAFGQFTRLQPKVSAGFAFLGLCLYQLNSYSSSLRALNQAERLGLPQGEQLTDVASYHASLLYIKDQNFERALQILNFFSRRETIDPKIIEAAGIAALRKAIFPAELATDDRELVYRVGRAVLTAGARRAREAGEMLEAAIQDYPAAPNLHFVYGSLLIGGDANRAIAEFQREIELQPKHLPSRVVLALEYLKRGEAEPARKYASEAVEIAPDNFAARVAYGRALVELEELEKGIAELELAVKLEPTSPQVRISLAAAYQKAGRAGEAARERAEFLRLKKILEGMESVR